MKGKKSSFKIPETCVRAWEIDEIWGSSSLKTPGWRRDINALAISRASSLNSSCFS